MYSIKRCPEVSMECKGIFQSGTVKIRNELRTPEGNMGNSTNHVKCGRILFLSNFAENKTVRFNTSKPARIQTLTLIRHFSAANCYLLPLCAVDGMAVTTIEGIGSTKTALHPVQVMILYVIYKQ